MQLLHAIQAELLEYVTRSSCACCPWEATCDTIPPQLCYLCLKRGHYLEVDLDGDTLSMVWFARVPSLRSMFAVDGGLFELADPASWEAVVGLLDEFFRLIRLLDEVPDVELQLRRFWGECPFPRRKRG